MYEDEDDIDRAIDEARDRECEDFFRSARRIQARDMAEGWALCSRLQARGYRIGFSAGADGPVVSTDAPEGWE